MTNNLAKWTPEQDNLLREGVQKHGVKWQLVKNYMKNIRSINSIIKRWHGKIKYQTQMKYVRQSSGRFTKVNPQPPNISFSKKEPENIVEQSHQKELVWNKNWSERQDKKLKLLVLQSGIMDWSLLSQALKVPVDQIKLRWKEVIYPKIIKQSSKVGGSLKWSALEDKILHIGYKQGINWESDAKIFLGPRSLGSLEARWRRVVKYFEVKSTAQNKYLARKDCLKRIARLRREAAQNEKEKEKEKEMQKEKQQEQQKKKEKDIIEQQ